MLCYVECITKYLDLIFKVCGRYDYPPKKRFFEFVSFESNGKKFWGNKRKD